MTWFDSGLTIIPFFVCYYVAKSKNVYKHKIQNNTWLNHLS